MTYTTITPQEVGRVAAHLGISGKPESLMSLVRWVEQRVLESQAQEAALERMADNARELGLDYDTGVTK